MTPTFALVGGGVRSGKSSFALALARSRGPRRAFVATAEALDDEMDARIAAHVSTRGPDFLTIEEPLALPQRLRELGGSDLDVVVVDCLTLWISNLLVRGDSPVTIAGQFEPLLRAIEQRTYHLVIVSNEVGMGVVPPSPLGRAFRDLVGVAHQQLARVADELYLAALGSIVRLRPEPICLPSWPAAL